MKQLLRHPARTLLSAFGYERVRRAATPTAQGMAFTSAADLNSKGGMNEYYSDPERVEQYLDNERVEFFHEVAARITCEDGYKVADIGCGPAVLLQRLAERRNIQAYALDHADVLRAIVERNVPGVRFRAGDIYDTGYPSGLFDLVLCTEVLEHLLHPRNALTEIMRTIRPGGQAVITVPDGRADTFAGHVNFWSFESFEVFLAPWEKDVVNRLPSGELMAVLTKETGA